MTVTSASASSTVSEALAAQHGAAIHQRRDLEAAIRGLSRRLTDARTAMLALGGKSGADEPATTCADPLAWLPLDALPAPCVILTGEGTMLNANRAFEAMVGLQVGAAIDRSAQSLFDHASWGAVIDSLHRARRSDSPIARGLRLSASGGGRRVSAAVAWYGLGEAPAFLMTLLPMEDARDDDPASSCASQAYAELAMEVQTVGCWEWDVLSDSCRWDAAMSALFGMAPTSGPFSLEMAMRSIHQADRPCVRERIIAGLEQAGPWTAEFRVVLATGQVRWIAARGRFVRNQRAKPVRLFGVCVEKRPATGEGDASADG